MDPNANNEISERERRTFEREQRREEQRILQQRRDEQRREEQRILQQRREDQRALDMVNASENSDTHTTVAQTSGLPSTRPQFPALPQLSGSGWPSPSPLSANALAARRAASEGGSPRVSAPSGVPTSNVLSDGAAVHVCGTCGAHGTAEYMRSHQCEQYASADEDQAQCTVCGEVLPGHAEGCTATGVTPGGGGASSSIPSTRPMDAASAGEQQGQGLTPGQQPEFCEYCNATAAPHEAQCPILAILPSVSLPLSEIGGRESSQSDDQPRLMRAEELNLTMIGNSGFQTMLVDGDVPASISPVGVLVCLTCGDIRTIGESGPNLVTDVRQYCGHVVVQ